MKRDPIYIIIILLLSVALFITWDSNRDKSLKADLKVSTAKQKLLESEKARQAEITRADSIRGAEERLRQEDKAKATEREKAFKSTISKQATRITHLQAIRAEQGITPDSLSQAIEVTQDSIIQAQAGEIETLHTDGKKAEESFNREISALESKWTAERETSIVKDQLILAQSSQIEVLGKKNKRLNKSVKVLVPVLIGETIYVLIKFFEPN